MFSINTTENIYNSKKIHPIEKFSLHHTKFNHTKNRSDFRSEIEFHNARNFEPPPELNHKRIIREEKTQGSHGSLLRSASKIATIQTHTQHDRAYKRFCINTRHL